MLTRRVVTAVDGGGYGPGRYGVLYRVLRRRGVTVVRDVLTRRVMTVVDGGGYGPGQYSIRNAIRHDGGSIMIHMGQGDGRLRGVEETGHDGGGVEGVGGDGGRWGRRIRL